MIGRRHQLAAMLSVLAAPRLVEAQDKRRPRLAIFAPVFPETELTDSDPFYRILFAELRRHSYEEGRTLDVDRWSARGDPARSPNLNAYAERWVRSVKEECLSKVIPFGERSLRRALNDYVEHFHAERNHHQGKGNVLLFPLATDRQREGPVQCRERLGGLLRYYHREAA